MVQAGQPSGTRADLSADRRPPALSCCANIPPVSTELPRSGANEAGLMRRTCHNPKCHEYVSQSKPESGFCVNPQSGLNNRGSTPQPNHTTTDARELPQHANIILVPQSGGGRGPHEASLLSSHQHEIRRGGCHSGILSHTGMQVSSRGTF